MIQDIFARTVRRYSWKHAVSDGKIQFTYNDLFIQKERVKEYFIYSLHIQENDKIAFFLPNCVEFIYCFFAASEIGAVIIPLNIHWKEKELQYCVIKCGIKTVITHNDLLSQWGKIPLQEKRVKFVLIDQLILTPQNARTVTFRKIEKHFFESHSLDTDVLYLYTSGSTGRPKIIPKTHTHLIAGAKNLGKALAVTSRDRFLGVAPFFHANGFENSMLLPIMKGASIILMRQYSPRSMLNLLEKEGITVLIGSPFIFSSLSDVADKTYNFSSIRFCLSAGAPLASDIKKTFFDKFAVTIREHYGASETGPLSVQLEDSQGDDRSVGKPFDKVKVKIIDEDGKKLPSDKTGEILIRSNSMIKGYLDDPELNDKAFTQGYFRTGDLGMLDRNGDIHILGRKKPIINAAGIKIDPVEIQNVLLSFPKVKDAFVTGMKNKRGMEIVKAIVVPQPNCTVNDIIIYCKEYLADYKIPRIIEFRDKIPTDVMGKAIWSQEEE
jgi:long-chain acyl-CoA synthetase